MTNRKRAFDSCSSSTVVGDDCRGDFVDFDCLGCEDDDANDEEKFVVADVGRTADVDRDRSDYLERQYDAAGVEAGRCIARDVVVVGYVLLAGGDVPASGSAWVRL